MPGCEGGVDVLLVETCQDTRNIKAATLAIRLALRDDWRRGAVHHFGDHRARWAPMLAGGVPDGGGDVASLRHAHPLAFGMNCALGRSS